MMRLLEGLPVPDWLDLGQGLGAVESLLRDIPNIPGLRERVRELVEGEHWH